MRSDLLMHVLGAVISSAVLSRSFNELANMKRLSFEKPEVGSDQLIRRRGDVSFDLGSSGKATLRLSDMEIREVLPAQFKTFTRLHHEEEALF